MHNASPIVWPTSEGVTDFRRLIRLHWIVHFSQVASSKPISALSHQPERGPANRCVRAPRHCVHSYSYIDMTGFFRTLNGGKSRLGPLNVNGFLAHEKTKRPWPGQPLSSWKSAQPTVANTQKSQQYPQVKGPGQCRHLQRNSSDPLERNSKQIGKHCHMSYLGPSWAVSSSSSSSSMPACR